MKNSILLIILIYCASTYPLGAQNKSFTEKKRYTAYLDLNINDNQIKGMVLQLQDTTLLFVDAPNPTKMLKRESKEYLIPISKIDQLSFRKKGNVANGVLAGIVVGFTIGAISGYSKGDDPPDCWLFCSTASEKAVGHGFLYALPGALIGGLIGNHIRVRIPIDGKKATYQREQAALKKFVYIQ